MRKKVSMSLFAGLLPLSALFLAVTHYGDLERFLLLLGKIRPFWIGVAFLFQFGTYIALALVWHRAMKYSGIAYPLRRLVPLAVAKLFADQALPSGGISGIAFVVNAFRQRSVSRTAGMAVMLLSILSYYASSVLAASSSLLILWFYHRIRQWMVIAAGMFFVSCCSLTRSDSVGKAVGARTELPGWVSRLPVVAGILETYADVSDDAVRNPGLFAEATLFQTVSILLDAAKRSGRCCAPLESRYRCCLHSPVS
jgi:uncharacterized membrane protein YbhN (UPF0104 family)